MTNKTTDWSTGKPQKMEGWFSWRHRTDAAHTVAREAYLSDRGPAARRRKAGERADAVVQRWRCGHRSSRADHPCTVRA